jgi:hypothetical protein
MKINMFEGARRITKLIAVLWVVGMCIYIFTWNPHIHAYFHVDSSGSESIRVVKQKSDCAEHDAREDKYWQQTINGTDFTLTLCFKRISASEFLADIAPVQSPVIEEVQNNPKKSTLVTNPAILAELNGETLSYRKKVTDNFKPSKADEDWIDSEVWPARWKNIKESSLWIIGGVAFLYIFSWCVGWIIRGFAGIPLGHDRKSDDV